MQRGQEHDKWQGAAPFVVEIVVRVGDTKQGLERQDDVDERLRDV
jgi:hypothetical protein